MSKPVKRIVSGMRPTGPLHLGHYFGVLLNWIKLQEEYDCRFFVADWHAMTSEYADSRRIKGFVPGLVLDWVAAGLDPEKCVIFQQSQVKEHAELHLILSMLTPLSWLERNPTYKEVSQELSGQKDLATYGFLGYPVLMASDILLYRATAVPVGQDQLPHLELTRELARRFNSTFGELFPEPQAVLSTVPRLVGLDGRTMHTSYGNTIALSEDPEEIRRKTMSMVTDPQRIRKTIPGRPDVCTVFSLIQAVFPGGAPTISTQCQAAEIGCVSCKQNMAQQLIDFLEPFRRIRSELSLSDLDLIIAEGDDRAQRVAQATMEDVRAAMKLDRVPGRILRGLKKAG
jgi:tryptophanyl-tRNA synthetase